MEKQYEFTVTISACGDSPNDAWLNAVVALSMDPGDCPDESEYSITDPDTGEAIEA